MTAFINSFGVHKTRFFSMILTARPFPVTAAGTECADSSPLSAAYSVTAASGSFGAGLWTTVDITPLITSNSTFSIALTTTNNTAFSLASREGGANAPQLIIEMAP